MLRTYKKNLYVQTSKKLKARFFSSIYILLSLITLFLIFSNVYAADITREDAIKNYDCYVKGDPSNSSWPFKRDYSGSNNLELMILNERGCPAANNAKYTALNLDKQDGGGLLITKSNYLPTDSQNRLVAKINFSVKAGAFDPTIDRAAPKGEFTAADLDGDDDWNGILDKEDPIGTYNESGDGGLFIQLYKAPKKDTKADLNFTKEEFGLNGSDAYEFYQPLENLTLVKNYRLLKKDLKEIGSAPTDPIGEFRGGKNIGYYLFKQNPELFFAKSNYSFSILLDKLDPDTKYYYRVVVSEDDSSSAVAYSEVTEDTSFTTLPKGSPNPNQTPLEDDTKDGTGSTLGDEAQANLVNDLLECGASPSTWFSGCLVSMYNNLIYSLSASILTWSAGLLDTFISFSIGDTLYRTNFVTTGWTVVRDICNMFFIFILLWTAFKMVVNDSHFHANQVIVNIIIIGLLINFSLFFSKLIIDAGNITARVFYNQIRITGSNSSDLSPTELSKLTNVKPKSVSLAITKGLGVQKILANPEVIKQAPSAGRVFTILFLGTIVNIIAAWVFFKAAFNFLGRIVSLWFGMIFSPAAFTSKILGHDTEGLSKFGWKDWIKNMLDASFGAAIFLFFIFLIIQFITADAFSDIMGKNVNISSNEFLIAVLIPFVFIIGLVKAAGDISKKMAGMFGGAVAGALEGAAKFAGGAAIGLATGGAALAGSRLFGARAASTLAGKEGDLLKKASTGDAQALLDLKSLDSKKYGKWEAGEAGRKKAQERVERLQKSANSSYDLRNTKGLQALSSATGINFNAGLGSSSLGTAATAGGFQATIDKRAAKQAEYFKNIGASEEDVKRAKSMVDETKKDLEESEKSTRKEIERLEKENSNIVQQVQAGGAGDPAKVAANQTEIAKLQKKLDDAHSDAKVKDASGNFVTPPPSGDATRDLIANAKQKALKAEEDLKKSSKSGLRAYQEYLQNNFHHGGRQEQGAWFGVRGLRSVFRSDGLMGAASHFASGFGKDLKAAISGAWKGALVGSIIPGMGTIGGAVAGAVGGGVLGAMQKNIFDQRIIDMADHAVAENHLHGSHAKASYKQPGGAWLDKVFSGGGFSSGGGGHGGGHDAGHDDHGGGHH